MEGGGSSYSDEQSVDSFPDEESVTETEEDENSENSEDDGEMKEEIDPWATMIDDAKATVRPEYDEFMKTLQMDGREETAAKQEAFESVLPELQKEFAGVYADNLRWMKALMILCIERLWKRRRHLRTKTRLILMKLYLQRLTKESFC
jgi:hypothetical protein